MYLTAAYAWRRSPLAGCAAALLIGLNSVVIQFGTAAQAYGACVFLTVAAFRATLADRALLGGALAGIAASCSLLSAPALPVLVAWHAVNRRWRATAVTALGGLAGLAPILSSFVAAPALTWFNLFEYHLYYRRTGWEDTTEFDMGTLTSFLHSWPAILLMVFAILGIWKVRRRRDELWLAIAMAAALALEAAVAHPTFRQYFILTVPFVGIVAGLGFAKIATRTALVPLAALLAIASAATLYNSTRDATTWTRAAALARKIKEVTRENGEVLADPPVYFALKREPPTGMEFPASHDLEFSAGRNRSLHIVPWSSLTRDVHEGRFATVETCKGDEDEIIALELPKLYKQSISLGTCQVYWNFR
jgi:hypothetical protein